MESKQASEAYDAENARLIILREAVRVGIHHAENDIFSKKLILDLIDDE
ncbi:MULTISPECIES: hypothetical protein [unclassified Rickettsia]|nr:MULTISPECIES: hypothetical protein [unclassified Rickettsia]